MNRNLLTITVTPREGPPVTLVGIPVPCDPSPPEGADVLAFCVRSKEGKPFRVKHYPDTLAEAVVLLAEIGTEAHDLVAIARVHVPRPHDIEARWHRGASVWEPWVPVQSVGTAADGSPMRIDMGITVTADNVAACLSACAGVMQTAWEQIDDDEFDITVGGKELVEQAAAAMNMAMAVAAAKGVPHA